MTASLSTLRRSEPATQIPPRGAVVLFVLALSFALASCGSGGGGGGGSIVEGDQIRSACADSSFTTTSFTYANTTEVAVAGLITDGDFLTVNIPEEAVGVGLVVQGRTTGFKIIDHGIIFIDNAGNPTCITTQDGRNAPLAFNQVDFDDPPDGIIEDDPNLLLKRQTAALFFPNDGRQLDLPAGTYSFPVGNADEVTFELASDTLQPYLFYKTPTSTQTTLRINLFVASGVRSAITDAATAAGDAEIQGAITVLNNVYANNLNTALNLNVTVAIVPSSFVTVGSQSEMDSLLSGHPGPPAHDAVNLFVIGQIAVPGVDPGVLGMAAGIPGPFNRQATFNSGVLAEYQGDSTGTKLGFILTHELGHYLGLYHTSQTNQDQTAIIGHDPIDDTMVCTSAMLSAGGLDNCPDKTNVMFPVVASVTTDPPISPLQGRVVRLNPAVRLADSDGDGILDFLDDDTPDPFAFVAVVNASPGSDFTSNEITVSGVNASGFTLASVTGGVLIKNDVALADSNTTVGNGDRLRVRLTSSAILLTEVSAVLTVGDFSASFSITTVPPTWLIRASLLTNRWSMTGSTVAGKIYAIGGRESSNFATGRTDEYDPGTDLWIEKSAMPTARRQLTSSVVDGIIYVIGGWGGSNLSAVEAYDPSTDSWSTKSPMPAGRSELTSSVVNGKIYVIGGVSDTGTTNVVEEYDPAADTWTTKSPMPTVRSELTSSMVNGIIYVFGGFADSTLEVYDPAIDSWSTGSNSPIGGPFSSSTAGGSMYVFGKSSTTAVFKYNPALDPLQ